VPLGDPDIAGPKIQDIQWLGLLAQLVFPKARCKVLVANAAKTGFVRVAVSFNGGKQELTVPVGVLANRDWKEILAHWRASNEVAIIVRESDLVH
jgi:hypothetical protein